MLLAHPINVGITWHVVEAAAVHDAKVQCTFSFAGNMHTHTHTHTHTQTHTHTGGAPALDFWLI
jgi:hypothetical protein